MSIGKLAFWGGEVRVPGLRKRARVCVRCRLVVLSFNASPAGTSCARTIPRAKDGKHERQSAGEQLKSVDHAVDEGLVGDFVEPERSERHHHHGALNNHFLCHSGQSKKLPEPNDADIQERRAVNMRWKFASRSISRMTTKSSTTSS